MEDLVQLLLADPERMKAMECARSLALPDCYIAAGSSLGPSSSQTAANPTQ